MGFFSGRVTCTRFRVAGRSPGMFGPAHLEKLEARAIGKHRALAGDGVEVGWTAGDHILDTDFDLEKNVVNDALHFCLRVDSGLEELRRRLEDAGIETHDTDEIVGRPRFFCRDPFGNRVELTEWRGA